MQFIMEDSCSCGVSECGFEEAAGRKPDKEIIPAGIFYYHLDDPMVEAEETLSEEQILREVLKKASAKWSDQSGSGGLQSYGPGADAEQNFRCNSDFPE